MPNGAALNFEGALEDARKNWLNWKDVYSHEGDIAQNPILASRLHFGCFLWEYGVTRTVKAGHGEALQRAMRSHSPLHAAIEAGDSRNVAGSAHDLSPRFASYARNTFGLLSLVSKVAAFCRPSKFIAWDTFGRRGLAIMLDHPESRFDAIKDRVEAYALFQEKARTLAAEDSWWGPDNGRAVDAVAARLSAPPIAFRLRVLDLLAMRQGGWVDRAPA